MLFQAWTYRITFQIASSNAAALSCSSLGCLGVDFGELFMHVIKCNIDFSYVSFIIRELS